MKVFSNRQHRRFDRTTEQVPLSSHRFRSPTSRLVAMVLIALILACVEREILGVDHGSLTSMIMDWIADARHYLAAIPIH